MSVSSLTTCGRRRPSGKAAWKAAGVPVEPGSNGRIDQAYVNTPDGLRIEILESQNQSAPIQSEHVHFFLPEAAIPQSQAWYAKIFAAKASQRNNAPVADIPGVQLRFAKAERPGSHHGPRPRRTLKPSSKRLTPTPSSLTGPRR